MKLYLNSAISMRESGENWTALQPAPVKDAGNILTGASRSSHGVEEGTFVREGDKFFLNTTGSHAVNSVDCVVEIDPKNGVKIRPIVGGKPSVFRPELFALQLMLQGESLRRKTVGEEGTWERALKWIWGAWVVLPIKEHRICPARAYARQGNITDVEAQQRLDEAWELIQANYREFTREFPGFSRIISPPVREEIEGKAEEI